MNIFQQASEVKCEADQGSLKFLILLLFHYERLSSIYSHFIEEFSYHLYQLVRKEQIKY